MSDRGSFVTEFIYCAECLAACKAVLLSRDKHLCSVVIPTPSGQGDCPIIAGKIAGLSSGEELITMEFELKPKLDDTLCHPVRVSVLAENGQSRVFVCGPEVDTDSQNRSGKR